MCLCSTCLAQALVEITTKSQVFTGCLASPHSIHSQALPPHMDEEVDAIPKKNQPKAPEQVQVGVKNYPPYF